METVDKLNLKSLRVMADKMGVAWSKKDDEATLRKKVAKQRDAAESTVTAKGGTAFDTTKRAPFIVITDPRTKKPVRDPQGCFGYFFLDKPASPEDVDCKAQCPHWKPCKVLSKDADKVLSLAAEADEAETAKKEAEEVDEADLKLAEAAKSKKTSKKAESKPASILKEEKRVGTIDLETTLKVEFDLDYALAIDDDDLRKFYKRVVKKHGEGAEVSVEDIVLIFCETQGIDDPEPVVDEFLPQMVANEEFSVVD